MIYEMSNFLCILASIVITRVILYPWGVVDDDEFFYFFSPMENETHGAWGNGVLSMMVQLHEVLLHMGAMRASNHILCTSLAERQDRA